MKSWSIVSALLAAVIPRISAAPTAAVELEYEYVVVGSGAGGGPLACRLAMAGHKTLLIEAGDDQVCTSLRSHYCHPTDLDTLERQCQHHSSRLPSNRHSRPQTKVGLLRQPLPRPAKSTAGPKILLRGRPKHLPRRSKSTFWSKATRNLVSSSGYTRWMCHPQRSYFHHAACQ